MACKKYDESLAEINGTVLNLQNLCRGYIFSHKTVYSCVGYY